jgi:hypothetical protein
VNAVNVVDRSGGEADEVATMEISLEGLTTWGELKVRATLYNIQCSEICTLMNTHFHTETKTPSLTSELYYGGGKSRHASTKHSLMSNSRTFAVAARSAAGMTERNDGP